MAGKSVRRAPTPLHQSIEARDGSVVQHVVQASHVSELHVGPRIYVQPQEESPRELLARAAAMFEARLFARLVPNRPSEPYKSLYPFGADDSAIFFGRYAAADDLVRKIARDRLTVLHARSGTGKTSLLNAGLWPRLLAVGSLPVYARSYGDPSSAVRRALVPADLGPWPPGLAALRLRDLLGLFCARLGRSARELVIVLDQFEEFFVFRPEPAERQTFCDELAECFEDSTLSVRWVLSIRKDYYSDLAEFQLRLPNIFGNELRLDPLSREEAWAAIVRPLEVLGSTIHWEPALMEKLLDDLFRSTIELPHLQIVCDLLYQQAVREGRPAIRPTDYRRLGALEGVLGRYLRDVLARMPGDRAALAREILKDLVSSAVTRRAAGEKALIARLRSPAGEVRSVLADLVHSRLLSREEVEGKTVYELAHECLVEEIRRWLDQSDLQRKQAEELLAREIATWRTHGTLVPDTRLVLLGRARDSLRGLSEDVYECLMLSALEAGRSVDLEEWVDLCGDPGERVLLAALAESRIEQSGLFKWHRALWALARRWSIPGIGDLAREPAQCLKAIEALGKLRDDRTIVPLAWVWKRSFERYDEEGARVPDAVEEALVGFGKKAARPLHRFLRDHHPQVRERTARALGRIASPASASSLARALEAEENARIRKAQADALARLGKAAARPLIRAFHDAKSRGRDEAAVALGRIGEASAFEAVAAAYDEGRISAVSGISALALFGNRRALGRLIDALASQDDQLGPWAALGLGWIADPEAVGPLLVAVRQGGRETRRRAAEALGNFPRPEVVETLRSRLQDEEIGWLKMVALRSYLKIGGQVDEMVLSLLWRPSPAANVAFSSIADWSRSDVARELRHIGWPIQKYLIDHLDGPRGEEAVRLLASLKESMGLEVIAQVLLGPAPANLRVAAAESLDGFADFAAVEPLMTALHSDEDEMVRQAAAWSLGYLFGKSRAAHGPWSEEDPAPRMANPPPGCAARVVGALLPFLEHADPGVRRGALNAVWSFDDPRVMDSLIRALPGSDESFQGLATMILEKFDTPEARKAVAIWRPLFEGSGE